MESPNNSVINFMRNRRSVPAKLMVGPGPDSDQLRTILEIASRVPDHGKLAPWRFIRYGKQKSINIGEKILSRAKEIAIVEGRVLSEDEMEIERNRFLRTPVVVAVVSCAQLHPKIPQWEQILSCGAVAMNLLIGANAHGYDAQWLTEWYAYDEALNTELGLKTGERFAGFVHIGTRQNPKGERSRPELDDIYSTLEN
ncbi:MAG: nitroreductase [Rhizobiaceae bacterium]|nr:nitroreductase [Rhizobiaceae bacterium]